MRHALGIDVGGTSVRVGLVREDGAVVASASRPTGFETPREEVLARLAAAIREVLAGAAGLQIEGAGIGMPGLQDEMGRVVSASNLPELNGVDLRAEVSRVARVPAAMENDLNVVALGEYYFGGHAVAGNLLVVAVGTGVGAAVVQGGRLLRVFRGSLGDPGHILVEPGGPLCRCGAREVIKRAAGWLGMGLASFCALYQPERIVLGGNVLVEGADLLLPAAHQRMRECVQPWMRDIRVELSRIPQTAGVLGGAALVLRLYWSGVRGQGPGTRGQGPGVRGQGSGAKDQGSGARGQGPGVRGPGPGTRGQEPGVRGQEPGVRAVWERRSSAYI